MSPWLPPSWLAPPAPGGIMFPIFPEPIPPEGGWKLLRMEPMPGADCHAVMDSASIASIVRRGRIWLRDWGGERTPGPPEEGTPPAPPEEGTPPDPRIPPGIELPDPRIPPGIEPPDPRIPPCIELPAPPIPGAPGIPGAPDIPPGKPPDPSSG